LPGDSTAAVANHREGSASGTAAVSGFRILVITNMYPTPAEPEFGCFVRDQVDDLRELGVVLDVLAFDGRTNRSRYLGARRRLRRTLRRGRYDVVHAHYGLTGAVAASQLRTPVVTTFHGSDAWIPWQRAVSRLVARRTQPIAVAPVIAESLHARGAPVIPCAVDLDRFSPVDRDEARSALGWPADARCILLPAARGDATKVFRKQVDLFDAMIERLRREIKGVFPASLDGLSRDDVALAMNAADVAVMTSLWEGAPVGVKEALACQTPVVSVVVGDVPGVVRGLPGCAIVPRDPVALALAVQRALGAGRQPRLREAMRAYGRRATAERVLGVYHRTIAPVTR
jgi:glycosyltransferase involved in cell wall biosynthesis